ncbi:MAG TPA: hypothetical protein VNL77_14265 [Roseiflexaceae bacterium]|nr:hypothetical protein [Roseiflexaceae bacterium]
MCGGVRFMYDPALESALAEVYTPEQLARARASGVVESVFWQARPVLPALLDGELRLLDWGNREEQLKLPKTGWVRIESLQAGKWNYLRPREVVIPAIQGVEKKVWFGIDHGIRGFLVTRGDVARLYMLTLPPTPEYQALTGHNRMPALIDQELVVPLAA